MNLPKISYSIIIVFFLILVNQKPVKSFGKGPMTHAVITQIALMDFANQTGREVDFVCAEALIQGSILSDNLHFGALDTYHCDNNNIAGCSYRLDQLKGEANREFLPADSLKKMGQALHIVQDFYSHSNWVERFQLLMLPAPIEMFKDIPPPIEVQTGFFPDFYPDTNAQILCYFAPEESWSGFILGATHDCLNKDSDTTKRGSQWVPNTGGKTYHELAGEYAIQHSVELLKYFSRTNIHFKECTHPNIYSGCTGILTRMIERNNF